MKPSTNNRLIVILGPTACGKTVLASHLALALNGEVISADSRQVYRGMDIGTGKDLNDYIVDEQIIRHHLIDIVEPGFEYNLFLYQEDFISAFEDINERGKMAIMCGGTGMYIDSILKRKKLLNVPENHLLRAELATLSMAELSHKLENLRPLHNITDIRDSERLIRAIEIELFNASARETDKAFPAFDDVIFGVNYEREIVMKRIENRLKQRLEEGMIEEVEQLINKGVSVDKLLFYGLEYRYITRYILNNISYQGMFESLNIAIRQFAKRQMTYFRKMERDGMKINWIPQELNLKEKLAYIKESL